MVIRPVVASDLEHVTPLAGSRDRAETRLRAARAIEDLARHRGAGHLSLDVDIDEAGAITFYQVLGYTVVRRHQHHWRALDPRTGAVVDEGIAPTLIMRRRLESAA